MKTYPPRSLRRARHVRVPAFFPVPLRGRTDGWTPKRQADFLGALAETRCVTLAARRVRMARETAYRLRRRRGGESFAAAWDAALGRGGGTSRKVTDGQSAGRAFEGLLKPHFWHGKHVGNQQKADNGALLAHLAQLDRALAGAAAIGGRSQSFAAGFASTQEAALERRFLRYWERLSSG